MISNTMLVYVARSQGLNKLPKFAGLIHTLYCVHVPFVVIFCCCLTFFLICLCRRV
uniref:Uncharacterized protein n=1 Tax=Arundo donax TaxID=35708 RepID=A0A0A9GNG4_ARUDO